MKLKITQREKNMLLILIGVLLLAVSYNFGYRTLKAETERLKLENKAMESQIQALKTIDDNKEKYVTETQQMQQNMGAIMEAFPADIISEDVILHVRSLEQKTDVCVNHVSIPSKKYLEVAANTETDILSTVEDVTGIVRQYSFVGDGSIPRVDNMNLSKVESEVIYSVTYDGFKEIVKYIVDSDYRRNIDDVSLVFNENTGDLAGSMKINYFALSGIPEEYKKPVLQGTSYGVDCIFGDLNNSPETEE